MISKNLLLFSLLSVCVLLNSVTANALIIDPNDDGTVYSDGYINPDYIFIHVIMRGVIEFSTEDIDSPIAQAILSINPLGMPVHDKTIEVYGYESDNGIVTSSDYDAGDFLGILTVPEDIDFGIDAFFDVTEFVNSATTDFIGFNLRTTNMVALSTMENNLGHPSQLIIQTTLVPEPSTLILFLLGLTVFFFKSRRTVN